MYSEDTTIKSARRAWENAPAIGRSLLLKDAGYKYTLAYAYRAWDELPMILKIDLNALINRHQEAA